MRKTKLKTYIVALVPIYEDFDEIIIKAKNKREAIKKAQKQLKKSYCDSDYRIDDIEELKK